MAVVADACHRVSEPTGLRATPNIGVKASRGIDCTFQAAVHHSVPRKQHRKFRPPAPRFAYDEVIVQGRPEIV